ncbi:MAG: co-chaperone GroES family protein [Candidatus Delongbacteria bacterium]
MSQLEHLRIIGDRVLILPDAGQQRSGAGLYLPPSVSEKDSVQGGTVVAVGPGTPMPDPESADEPWRAEIRRPRHLPLEVEVGDYALYLKKAAIELSYRNRRYLIVPLAGILLVERDENRIPLDELLGE